MLNFTFTFQFVLCTKSTFMPNIDDVINFWKQQRVWHCLILYFMMNISTFYFCILSIFGKWNNNYLTIFLVESSTYYKVLICTFWICFKCKALKMRLPDLWKNVYRSDLIPRYKTRFWLSHHLPEFDAIFFNVQCRLFYFCRLW